MKRKSQAAMEFIMTYGWAILIFIAVLSALAYFGVLSPNKIPPDVCTVGPGFACVDVKATEDTLVLGVRNGALKELSSFSVGFDDGVSGCTSATASGKASPDIPDAGTMTDRWWFNATNTTIREGVKVAEFTFTGCTFSGRAVTGFTIYHTVAGETVGHTVNGQANLRVEK